MEQASPEEIKNMFDILDGQQSGTIKLEELSSGLRALGLNPSETQLENFFCRANVNTDGTLSFEEFCRIYQECLSKNKVTYDGLMKELGQFDRNNDGTISIKELHEILCLAPRGKSSKKTSRPGTPALRPLQSSQGTAGGSA